MGEINTRLELLNTHTKSFKLLKKIELKTGLETGSSAMILMSIIFSWVLFGDYSQFICEAYSLLYPSYASLYLKDQYWVTYWVLNCILSIIFTLLPSLNFFFSVRFLLTSYLLSPTIMKSSDLHDYLTKNIYSVLKS